MFRPILDGEESWQVVVLHKALAALGAAPHEDEVAAGVAGPDTRARVRELQDELRVVPDDSFLVDEPTSEALVESLRNRLQLARKRAFRVSGGVRRTNGTPVRGVRVLAFDLDLRAIGRHRDIRSAAELAKGEGFDYLGEARSDARGHYTIDFYQFLYRRAERKLADVVVFAVRDEEVIGCSSVVVTSDYSKDGAVADLAVVIDGGAGASEYAESMKTLAPFLAESRVSLAELGESRAQLDFCSRELDLPVELIGVAGDAARFIEELDGELSHELTYALGRQGLRLSAGELLGRSVSELRKAIERAVELGRIERPSDCALDEFVSHVRARAAAALAGADHDSGLGAVVAVTLPEEPLRAAFFRSLGSFGGNEFESFWQEHLPSDPAFRDRPELVAALIDAQRLSALTGGNRSLLGELQGRQLTSPDALLALEDAEWRELIEKAGVPSSVSGEGDEALRVERYAAQIRTTLNAAFPAKVIAKLIDQKALPLSSDELVGPIREFLSGSESFDIGSSRIHDHQQEIATLAGEAGPDVARELQRLQRVFLISPSPRAMTGLMERGLDSAHAVASVPRKIFIRQNADSLGGREAALAVHRRAEHIARRAEMLAVRLHESIQRTPSSVMSDAERESVFGLIEDVVPDYATLFGRPELCECKHCRSVYGPAAYYVDLLRFLERSGLNDQGHTPLDVLARRRPDLLHLLLTCENTNTLVPHVDLANEVMEYHVAHGSLDSFEGYDTAGVSAGELRASAQNVDVEAYRVLKDSVFPFTLPYHQPLDVIRTYGSKISLRRVDLLRAVNPTPNPEQRQAIAAEALGLSPEQYAAITRTHFSGAPVARAVHEYWGVSDPSDLESLTAVPRFLDQSGVGYSELGEILRTRFVNPGRQDFELLEGLLSHASVAPEELWAKLQAVRDGSLDPVTDEALSGALEGYFAAAGGALTPAAFAAWVAEHLEHAGDVVTLYQASSRCDLDTTELRTLAALYDYDGASGLAETHWARLHGFIRLWRCVGWSIRETDTMLAALGQSDLGAETVTLMAPVLQLLAQTDTAVQEVATVWGSMDGFGEGSLYAKLFLSRTLQEIDPVFEGDGWGRRPAPGQTLGAHRSAILAAMRIREEAFEAILQTARVIEAGTHRPLSPTDALDLPHLSVLYRHVVLARMLAIDVLELCRLIDVFDSSPFSTWDEDAEAFVDIDPSRTQAFCRQVTELRAQGLAADAIAYATTGVSSPTSKLGLSPEETANALRELRATLAAIETERPSSSAGELTEDQLRSELSLTFEPEAVNRLLDIAAGHARYAVDAGSGLGVIIPGALSEKFTYDSSGGGLVAHGVMTGAERAALQALPGADPGFHAAVDALHEAPASELADGFGELFDDLAEAEAILLDRPMQAPAASVAQRLRFVHERFVPHLKSELATSAIIAQLSTLTGMESSTVRAISDGDDLRSRADEWRASGLDAVYYSDSAWTTPVLSRVDSDIDFDWGVAAPELALPADGFSVRWEGYLDMTQGRQRTLEVVVGAEDDAFALRLGGETVLTKATGDTGTSFTTTIELDPQGLCQIRLDYAHATGPAGVRLRWGTPIAGREAVESRVLVPASARDSFDAAARGHDRAAVVVDRLGLDATEARTLSRLAADFDGLDFTDLTLAQLRRLAAYARLRDALPETRARLIDVFEVAASGSSMDELKTLVSEATGWAPADVSSSIDHFGFAAADLANERGLHTVRPLIELSGRTGLSASSLVELGGIETDFGALHATAQRIKQAVKAQYGHDEWLHVAAGLSDSLRNRQRDALVAQLLTLPAISAWGARDANGLFEYLLIDVQTDACMDTSRIVQATAAVQLFVHRILLNLESGESGVSPAAIDRHHWAWMETYRVWEANRKVFLYPENWLDPAWRLDKSNLFRSFEDYITQNDATEETAADGLRAYLKDLADLSSMDICGMAREEDQHGSLAALHVFGRTNNAPYQVHYRRWSRHGSWSAWEALTVPPRVVENGAKTGVHLIPVVWQGRLFLFWPEFDRKVVAAVGDGETFEGLADDEVASQSKYTWEIKLAFTERVNGRWTPKRLSSECVVNREWPYMVDDKEAGFRFSSEIGEDGLLRIYFLVQHPDGYWYQEGAFELADPSARPWANSDGYGWAHHAWRPDYRSKYMKLTTEPYWKELAIDGESVLREETGHDLLFSNGVEHYAADFSEPFFFSDAFRTYFVRPVSVRTVELVRWPTRWPVHLVAPLNVERFPITDGAIDPLPRYQSVPFEVTGTAQATPLLGSLGGAAPTRRVGLRDTRGDRGSTRTAKRLRPDISPSSGQITPVTPAPFAQHAVADLGLLVEPMLVSEAKRKYAFHTFHHPFANELLTRLNRRGLRALMATDVTLESDEGASFEERYDPALLGGAFHKPSDFAKHTYYKDSLCFDAEGANAVYNWELFFHAPLFVAIRLSRNGRFEEAREWFHLIFDPTTDEEPADPAFPTARFWKVLPFRQTPAQDLESWFRELRPGVETPEIAEWRDHPFDPHRVASNRPLAYMKFVVSEYVANLIAWADSLFRKDTREAVNEALQLYVMASHLLGPRPETVESRGRVRAESFHSLRERWDDFSNALVALENLFPYSSEVASGEGATSPGLLGLGSALYFCIPPNERLLEQWDTVADRLHKIRYCQNIDGVRRQLALFAPPIDPAMLIAAAARGVSLGAALADLGSPPPLYRFGVLHQRALDFCSDVQGLGSALLSALEKKDAEELARLRSSHEASLLEQMTAVRERQLLNARANRDHLLQTRKSAAFRLAYHSALLGNEPVEVPAPPSLPQQLSAESQLPEETVVSMVVSDVDQTLATTEEAGVKILRKEKLELDKIEDARLAEITAQGFEAAAAVAHIIPTMEANGKPLGVGGSVKWGGTQLGNALGAAGKIASVVAGQLRHEAGKAAKMAGFIRREQEWTFQANQALRQIVEIDKQLVAAELQIRVAEEELKVHRRNMENAEAIEDFLSTKFSGTELYRWMRDRLRTVYKDAYELAYDMAKQAERAYRFERGLESSDFIKYGYWESDSEGLLAGERLRLALRRLTKAHLEEHHRELELSKTISLVHWSPAALIQLRETGRCYFSLPEELFDLDYRGHYFRRIRAVRLSIPAVVGPHATIACTLRLLDNSTRVETSMGMSGQYERETDDGVFADDHRFRTFFTPTRHIATSHARNDAGLFEVSFSDERYLPFEGAGAISSWQLELSSDADLRTFDYATISDVLLHIDYTARLAGGGRFVEKATEHLKSWATDGGPSGEEPFTLMVSVRREYPSEWHRFEHGGADGVPLEVTLGQGRFPFVARGREIRVSTLQLLVRTTVGEDLEVGLQHSRRDGVELAADSLVRMPVDPQLGELRTAELSGNAVGLDIPALDVTEPIAIRVKPVSAPGFESRSPEDIQDVILVLQYRLS